VQCARQRPFALALMSLTLDEVDATDLPRRRVRIVTPPGLIDGGSPRAANERDITKGLVGSGAARQTNAVVLTAAGGDELLAGCRARNVPMQTVPRTYARLSRKGAHRAADFGSLSTPDRASAFV
jgi:hypothetical protein